MVGGSFGKSVNSNGEWRMMSPRNCGQSHFRRNEPRKYHPSHLTFRCLYSLISPSPTNVVLHTSCDRKLIMAIDLPFVTTFSSGNISNAEFSQIATSSS